MVFTWPRNIATMTRTSISAALDTGTEGRHLRAHRCQLYRTVRGQPQVYEIKFSCSATGADWRQ